MRRPSIFEINHPLEYRTWAQMKTRCSNERAPNYKYYGAKGIKVCDRWESFQNFLEDMGPRPSTGYSIDRIDSSGNYEPTNCRWATTSTQNLNRSISVKLTYQGKPITIAEASAAVGMSEAALRSKIRRKKTTLLEECL